MNKKNRKKGFTLVELIVVIAILAILATIAVPTTIAVLDKGKDQAANTELNEGVNALVNEIVGNKGNAMFASKSALNDAFPALLEEVGVANSIEFFEVIYDIEEVAAASSTAGTPAAGVAGYKYTVSIKVTSKRNGAGMHKAVQPITKRVTMFETVEDATCIHLVNFPEFTTVENVCKVTYKNNKAAEQSGAIKAASIAAGAWTCK